MILKNAGDFEKEFIDKFGDIDRTSLSKQVKIRCELGGEESDLRRVEQALDRAIKIFSTCFKDSDIWLRVVLWDKKAMENLKAAGLCLQDATIEFGSNTDNSIRYIYYEKFSKSIIYPFISTIINYDLGYEPSANITCYFLNFNLRVIVNLYDDRGLDIYSQNKTLLQDINKKFKNLILE